MAEGLELRFQYFVPKIARDGKVPLTIIRDGQTMTVDVPAPKRRPLILQTLRGGTPSYFICGPIAFTNATSDLVLGAERLQRGWFPWLCANQSPLALRLADRPKFPDEQIVVIPCPLFTHKIIKGYSDVRMQTVREINGIAIKNLRHLVETIRDCKDELIVIAFAEQYAETIVLDRKELLAATEDVLADNSIRKLASDDLLPVWEKK